MITIYNLPVCFFFKPHHTSIVFSCTCDQNHFKPQRSEKREILLISFRIMVVVLCRVLSCPPTRSFSHTQDFTNAHGHHPRSTSTHGCRQTIVTLLFSSTTNNTKGKYSTAVIMSCFLPAGEPHDTSLLFFLTVSQTHPPSFID